LGFIEVGGNPEAPTMLLRLDGASRL